MQPYVSSARSFLSWLLSTLATTTAFWLIFGTCVSGCIVDMEPPNHEPLARLVAVWDPLACGDPHRVVVELEDEDGVDVSGSAPCTIGGITLDLPGWGI